MRTAIGMLIRFVDGGTRAQLLRPGYSPLHRKQVVVEPVALYYYGLCMLCGDEVERNDEVAV